MPLKIENFSFAAEVAKVLEAVKEADKSSIGGLSFGKCVGFTKGRQSCWTSLDVSLPGIETVETAKEQLSKALQAAKARFIS